LLLHEYGLVRSKLAYFGFFFSDGVGPVVITVDNASCQELAPRAGCCISPDGQGEVKAVTVKRVA
jgi:hypothetical protein